MRFLFECVSCCIITNPSSTDEPSSPATSKSEETRSLVSPAPARVVRRRKRTPARGSSGDWKPSLFAIAEDNAVPMTPEKNENRQRDGPVAAQRNVKRCGPPSVRVNAQSRSHDFGRDPLPMAFPAFSAAPFMF